MSKFYACITSEEGISWREQEGTKVKNEFGLDLFADKRGSTKWIITEGRTGTKVAEGRLKKQAIEDFNEKITRLGIEFFEDMMEIHFEKFGESPIYTDTHTPPTKKLRKKLILPVQVKRRS